MRVPKRLRPALRVLVPDFIRTIRGNLLRKAVAEATDRLWSLSGGRVLTGPFAGMSYVRTAGYSQLGPKILGTYERELWVALRPVLEGRTGHVVNVGAAEGYFACGFPFLQPSVRVTAFEASPESRELLRTLAERTGVLERLEILGRCDAARLESAIRARPGRPTLVLMDIEGAERHVLDPSLAPALGGVTIVVETHEFAEPGVTELLVDRFSPTHRVVRIPAEERVAAELPQVSGLSRRDLELVAFERDLDDQDWLWMRPRSDPAPASPVTSPP